MRRESIDHPEAKAAIENECSTCHMPLTHFTAQAEGKQVQFFSSGKKAQSTLRFRRLPLRDMGEQCYDHACACC